MEPFHKPVECEALQSQTIQENIMDPGLFAAVLQAYTSVGRKVPSSLERNIAKNMKNLRNPQVRKDKDKKTKKKLWLQSNPRSQASRLPLKNQLYLLLSHVIRKPLWLHLISVIEPIKQGLVMVLCPVLTKCNMTRYQHVMVLYPVLTKRNVTR